MRTNRSWPKSAGHLAASHATQLIWRIFQFLVAEGPSIKVNMHACAHDTTIQIHLAVFDKSNFIRKCIETCTSTKTEITTMTYAMFTTFLSK